MKTQETPMMDRSGNPISAETLRRIAIAQACSWTHCQPWKLDVLAVGRPPDCKGFPGQLFPIPFYHQDLKWMRLVEDHILKTDQMRKEYRSYLAECSDVFDATAEQRAEAISRMIPDADISQYLAALNQP